MPDRIIESWNEWINSLHALEKLEIRRSFKPTHFGKEKVCQIHAFSDSSDDGYGIAVYVKLVNENGEVATSLAFGKARVVPLDGESIPRSGLVAATMAAEFGKLVHDELDYDNKSMYLWTDSMVVLGYLRNKKKRFKLFVANRARKILKLTDLKMWNFVDSKNNPADDASRGITANSITPDHRWFSGPKFLTMNQELPDQTDLKCEIDDNDPELKKVQVTCAVTKPVTKMEEKITDDAKAEENSVLKIALNCSEWFAMKHKIACLIYLVNNRKVAKAADFTVGLLQ